MLNFKIEICLSFKFMKFCSCKNFNVYNILDSPVLIWFAYNEILPTASMLKTKLVNNILQRACHGSINCMHGLVSGHLMLQIHTWTPLATFMTSKAQAVYFKYIETLVCMGAMHVSIDKGDSVVVFE